ncbi:acyltransferase [Cereibacter sphaeroides]|uniref:acyltransferase family protein n=1 Tax=Cereibacter sphaeroides TaxID=1063 RepID=UPI001F27EE63|nr:acyltransferase family protein [Cereibacter sphaeroides]MCE6959223.1 acyltransferase [Cereibacter sphaeroides]MCE6972026.1 acyltransferase [Cereibacter sphaeroides]
MATPETSYRPDIDGLRTVAVLPVILFHAGFSSWMGIPIAPGGYVGVDVFFVISGFLISRIIYAEVTGGTWSVVGFYARRVRRIFPALFLVYLTCLAWAATQGIGAEAGQIRNAVMASVLFVSNVWFSMSSGYFDSGIQDNPLLHTWSLSIEEQFYIFFPLVLLALRPLRHGSRVALLVALVLASLGASAWMTRADPDPAYYSLATRAWELGIGGLLAIAPPRLRSARLAEGLGLAGLAAILLAILGFDKSTAFPGLAALLPVLGAAAVILSGMERRTLAGRFLGWAPMRTIGLMSYSLYLWHWPILVFMRLSGYGDRKSALLAIALCFLASWLSWRFVETPFRKGWRSAAPRSFFLGGAGAMAATLLLAMGVPALNRMTVPMDAETRRIAAFNGAESIAAMRKETCFLTSRSGLDDFRVESCLAADPARPAVLVIGDSHAAQHVRALQEANPQATILQATAAGCLPLLEARGERQCTGLRDFVFREFLPGRKLEAIVMVGRWKPGSHDEVQSTAERLLEHAERVVIVGPNAEYDTALPRLLALARVRNDPGVISDARLPAPEAVDREFRHHPHVNPRISYVSWFEAMCEPDCPLLAGDRNPAGYDKDHLSLSASRDFIARTGDELRFPTGPDLAAVTDAKKGKP